MLLSSRGRQASIYLLRIDLNNNKDNISTLDNKENSNKPTGNQYRVIYL